MTVSPDMTDPLHPESLLTPQNQTFLLEAEGGDKAIIHTFHRENVRQGEHTVQSKWNQTQGQLVRI